MDENDGGLKKKEQASKFPLAAAFSKSKNLFGNLQNNRTTTTKNTATITTAPALVVSTGYAHSPRPSGNGKSLCARKLRWRYILIPSFLLLCAGIVIVVVLWYWTNDRVHRDAQSTLDSAHDSALIDMGQSMGRVTALISLYAHMLETIEFLPFPVAEAMFQPILPRQNLTGGQCVVITRVGSLQRRRLLESMFTTYAKKKIVFFDLVNTTGVPTDHKEYWVFSHADAQIRSVVGFLGYDSMDKSNPIFYNEVISSVEKVRPVVSYSVVVQKKRLVLITEAFYQCRDVIYPNLFSPYNATTMPEFGMGNSGRCDSRNKEKDERMNLVSGGVGCEVAVNDFFSSASFMNSNNLTCIRVIDELDNNKVIWESPYSECYITVHNVSVFNNFTSSLEPRSSLFIDYGRRWNITHYYLPEVALESEDVVMLIAFGCLCFIIFLGASIGLYLHERMRVQDALVEQTKRESLRVFLDTTSHDMRSPLQASMNIVHILLAEQSDVLGPDGIQDIRTLRQALCMLEDIVSNILDFQKIEAGTMAYAEEKGVDILDELSNQLVIVGHEAALKSQLTFSFDICRRFNRLTTCDRARVCRSVINVVANAIRFTSQGTVDVRVDVLSSNSDCFVFQVVVRDTGIGIAETVIPRLFLPYEGAGINDGGGLGLGLFITKTVVDHYKGRASISSKINEGTCVILMYQLPVTKEEEMDGKRAIPVMDDSMSNGGSNSNSNSSGGGGGVGSNSSSDKKRKMIDDGKKKKANGVQD